MSKIKEGYSTKDYEAIEEQKALKGYPPWKKWRHALYKHLKKEQLGKLSEEQDVVLHKIYFLRRLMQLKEAGAKESLQNFSDTLPESFFENSTARSAVTFIVEKTPTGNDGRI
jgi:hypothetical protein